MSQRTIIIGDVHGCIVELEELLDKACFCLGKDELYFVGDIINRGPFSKQVYDKVKQLNALSILGNHELHLIREESGETPKRSWTDKIRDQFGEEYDDFLADIQNWPVTFETDEFLLVHAGLVPGLAPEDTDPVTLTRIRTWDGKGEDIFNLDHPHWYDLYDGDKLVVFGHWAALEGVNKKNAIGLDSGCVYGKKLTALILPERKLVSVDAKEAYCAIKYSKGSQEV